MEKKPQAFIYGLNKEAYIAELVKSAMSDNKMSRCLAAAAADTPRSMLKLLASDPEPMVRWFVANNKATPPKVAAQALEGLDRNSMDGMFILEFGRKVGKKKKAYYGLLY